MSGKHAETDSQVVDTIDPPTDDSGMVSRVVDVWTRDHLARPGVLAALAIIFIGYITYLLVLGPAPSTIFADDAFLLLDGGWRILNGLVPNHDFYLSLGPVIYLWIAGGLWVAHGSASGLSIGLTAFAAVVTVFAFLTARSRMTAAGTILYSLFTLLLCTAPMPLGGNPSADLSYAMIYNRFGYALLGIVYITVLLPAKRASKGTQSDWFPWITAGASLVVLFFLKVSFVALGAGIVVLSMFADPKNVRRWLPLGIGLGTFGLALLAFLRFDVLTLVSDLLATIRARGHAVSHFGITDIFEVTATSFITLAVVVCLLGEGKRRERMFLLGAACFTIVSEFFSARMNAGQGNTFPLCIIFIFVLLEYVFRNARTGGQPATFAIAVLVIALGFVTPQYYSNLRSVALLTRYKTNSRLKAAGFRVEGEHLKDLLFYDYGGNQLMRQENGRFYTSYLNDGIDLLKTYSSSSDIIGSLSFHNPFPYALLRKPPHGGSTWLLLGNNVAADHMPGDRRMFGDATVVMVPKPQLVPNTHTSTDAFLASYYKPYLLKHFVLAAASGQWSLYRRLPGQ